MRDKKSATVIVSEMQQRSLMNQEWKTTSGNTIEDKKNRRLLRFTAIFAVVFLLVSTGGGLILRHPEGAQMVMGHIRADFKYDEMLGRLQLVNHLLPESAMVFLENDTVMPVSAVPADAKMQHAWTQAEPWLEYNCTGRVSACLDGYVETIVKNRSNEYTVRISHQNGYESLYSGLSGVQVKEYDSVSQGQQIGFADGYTAFEWRKDGLSIPLMQISSENTSAEI